MKKSQYESLLLYAPLIGSSCLYGLFVLLVVLFFVFSQFSCTKGWAAKRLWLSRFTALNAFGSILNQKTEEKRQKLYVEDRRTPTGELAKLLFNFKECVY